MQLLTRFNKDFINECIIFLNYSIMMPKENSFYKIMHIINKASQ